jgi:hypothetical protein
MAAANWGRSTRSTASRPIPRANVYTTETYRGQRVQKFNDRGLAAVTKMDQCIVWPGKK